MITAYAAILDSVSIQRENALFDGSRLYRQAAQTSSWLWGQMRASSVWPTAARVFGPSATLAFSNPSELHEAARVLRRALHAELDGLSAYHVIPAMFQVPVDAYQYPADDGHYGANTSLAAKYVAVALTANSPIIDSGGSSAATRILKCLQLATAILHLRALAFSYKLGGEGHGTITQDGIDSSDGLKAVAVGMAHAFGPRGRIQRFSGDVPTLLFANPDLYLPGTLAVLAGGDPAQCPEFSGTYFSKLPPAAEAAKYWCRLAARLHLLGVAHQVTREVTSNPVHISIFGEHGWAIVSPLLAAIAPVHRQAIQQAIFECFWDNRFLAKLTPGDEDTAFIDRPIATICTSPKLFVTSPHNIVDSITRLTETAVVSGYTGPVYAFHDKVFKQLLADPFEHEIIELFRAAGFTAGEVTSKGAWKTQDGIVTVPGMVPEGQIDLLAWHSSARAIVADAKVLRIPDNERTADGLRSKFESFKPLLRRHRIWSEDFLRHAGHDVRMMHAAVILDRPWHFLLPDDDIVITDIDLVRKDLDPQPASA